MRSFARYSDDRFQTRGESTADQRPDRVDKKVSPVKFVQWRTGGHQCQGIRADRAGSKSFGPRSFTTVENGCSPADAERALGGVWSLGNELRNHLLQCFRDLQRSAVIAIDKKVRQRVRAGRHAGNADDYCPNTHTLQALKKEILQTSRQEIGADRPMLLFECFPRSKFLRACARSTRRGPKCDPGEWHFRKRSPRMNQSLPPNR